LIDESNYFVNVPLRNPVSWTIPSEQRVMTKKPNSRLIWLKELRKLISDPFDR
jgi:hypothetical protein